MSDEPVTRRVLIAEDQQGMRNLVHLLVDQEDDLTVVGAAATGREVLDLAAALVPDVIVLDLAMPEIDGERALATLHAEQPGVRVVVLSGQASAISQIRLEGLGAHALVEKGTPHWEAKLLDALRESG